MAKSNRHTGSMFDEFMKEDGIFDEVQARALKRALTEQIAENAVELEARSPKKQIRG